MRLTQVLWRRRGTMQFLLLAAAVASAPVARWWRTALPAHPTAREALDRRLPELRLEGVRLDDALNLLQRHVPELTFEIEWDALAARGVAPDTTVSCRLRQVRWDKILRVLLETAGGDAAKLDHIIIGRHLIITTFEGMSAHTTTGRYDVRDVVSSRLGVALQAELEDAILTLVTDIVASDTWRVNGGGYADIYCDNGWLVVTQTPENHRALARLLAQLRETRTYPIRILSAEFAEPWE